MDGVKMKRTVRARKVTRKVNELLNAIKGQVDAKEIDEKISTAKVCMEELGVVHDEYLVLIGDDNQLMEAEENWYDAYDVKVNQAIKEARYYVQQQFPAVEPEKKLSHVKLRKLDVPKFDCDPKTFHKWKSIYERYTKDCDDETKYDYLLMSTSGEARRYVENRTTYKEAMQKLEERYGNEHIVIGMLVGEIKSLQLVRRNDFRAFEQLSYKVNDFYDKLKLMGKENDADNSYIMKELESKLNYEDTQRWLESRGESVDSRTVAEFVKWLENQTHFRRITFSNRNQVRTSANENYVGDTRNFNRRPVVNSGNATMRGCPSCGSEHGLAECPEYSQLNLNERWERVKFLRCCFLCLKGGHQRQDCVETLCTVCSKPHHNTLHKFSASENGAITPISTSSMSGGVWGTDQVSRGYLPVLRINLRNGVINRKYTAVLDSGSEINIISSRCCQQLGLRGVSIGIRIIGAGGISKVIKAKRVELCVTDKSGLETKLECIVLSKACGQALRIDNEVKKACGQRMLNEKNIFTQGGDVDVLIGMTKPQLHKQISLETLSNGLAVMETCFGFCLVGAYPTGHVGYQQGTYRANNVCLVDDHSDEIKWRDHLQAELAGIVGVENPKTDEEMQFDQRIRITCEANGASGERGRFTVHLPWKFNPETFSNNKEQAIERDRKLLKQLERKNLLAEFNEQVKEMFTLGILRKVDVDFPKRYIPLLAVTNPEKRVRVCLDAKAKFKGVSFNDYLLKGKTEMSDIFQVLTAFRCGSQAIQGDIRKMFWQIAVSGFDQQFQGVIYDGETAVFTRVGFGNKPSPPIASECMKKTATLGKDKYPVGAEVLARKRFVDDIVDASCTTSKLIVKRDETSKLLGEFGFEIKEWFSNNPELGTVNEKGKVLGLTWDASKDNMSVLVRRGKRNNFTRRDILSRIAEIWDPLGTLTGLIVSGRLIFQAVVRMKVDWDQKVEDDELEKKWCTWLTEVEKCEELCVPRSILPDVDNLDDMKFELVGFSDGSSVAHGATVYIRWYDKDEKNIYVKFIGAKSKLNPIKGTTVPRAELGGAFVLSRLMHSAELALKNSELQYDNSKVLFTDSTTVLAWVKSASIKYKPFVKNKIIEIQELHPMEIWRYIPSSKNTTADLISKGCKHRDLGKIIKGPEILYWPRRDWPSLSPEENKEDINMEKVSSISTNAASVVEEGIIDASRFRSWKKLLRVTAYVFKYITKRKAASEGNLAGNLDESELSKAERYWVHLAQTGLELSTPSMQKLSPFKDDEDILRIYGRIKNIPLFDINRKHPIILPQEHEISNLIVKQAHDDCLHPGYLRVMAEVRKRYWIIGVRALAKLVGKKCVTCRRWRGAILEQKMANLPSFRISPSLPFENTAIDYFGPFQMKYGYQGRKKAYGAVFTCLTTRAVHVELATEITTDKFLMAMRRFISLYGAPKVVRSDNGSNFIGAARELREMIKTWKQNKDDRMKVADWCNSNFIHWTFSTPTTSHHNGAVESMVKSIKTSLNKVIKDKILNEEEYRTVFFEIASCINSRPLWPASDGDVSQPPLTCNDLLRPTGLPRDPVQMNVSMQPRKRYQHIQAVVNEWWKTWLLHFAPSLQCRNKWFKERKNLAVGDIVLIIDPTIKRSQWVMAIVELLYYGDDSLVRSVRVKSSSGSYDRPITKLCLLLSKEEMEEDQ